MPRTTQIPPLLLETMADFGMENVGRWWGEMGETARADVIELWAECGGPEGLCRVQVAVQWVEKPEPENDSYWWHPDFYEYLVNQEIYLLDEPLRHVCTRQTVAREAVRAGLIPASFACPIGDEGCLMRNLLACAPGKSARLKLRFSKVGDPRPLQSPVRH